MKIDSSLTNRIVTIKINDRDDNGKKIWNKFVFIAGKCTFAGINPITKEIQITIDRTPYFPLVESDLVNVE